MKQIYTVALAALVCGSAMAAGRMPVAENLDGLSLKVNPEVKMQNKICNNKLTKKSNATRSADAIESVAEMAGTWEWSWYDMLYGEEKSVDLTIEVADAETGEIAISGWRPAAGNFVVPATVDLANGTLTLPNNYYLGRDVYGDNNWFYTKELQITSEGADITDGPIDAEETYGTIIDNMIVFSEYEVWAIGEPDNEEAGWWILAALNQMDKFVSVDPSMGWEPYGTATFEDGWIIPGLMEDPSDWPWTVSVDKSTETEGLYRLNNPYASPDFPLNDMVTANGFIEFSIADPDFVTVSTGVFSGFDYQGKFYNFNVEGAYAANGYDPEEIAAYIEGNGSEVSYYADGVAYLNNCRFDDKRSCTSFYTWQDDNGLSLDYLMNGKVIFDQAPGSVGTLGAEKLSKVEYFNLQGMPVSNPAKGQLVIKRTAKGAVKVIGK